MGEHINYNPGPYDYSKPAWTQPGPLASRNAAQHGTAHLYLNQQRGGQTNPPLSPREHTPPPKLTPAERATARRWFGTAAVIVGTAAVFYGCGIRNANTARDTTLPQPGPETAEAFDNAGTVAGGTDDISGTTVTGEPFVASKSESALRAERAQAVLTNPGSDYYNYEFRTAGDRALELATLYADFLYLVDPSGSQYKTIADAQRLQSWKRVAYKLLPEENEYPAFCLVRRISALQQDVGLVRMMDAGHPLWSAGGAANPTYAEEIKAWDKSCGR